eukprot:jgi/Tetstr1/463764/TSEL_008580.t1
MGEDLPDLDEEMLAVNLPYAVAATDPSTTRLTATTVAVNTARRGTQPDQLSISPAARAFSAPFRSPRDPASPGNRVRAAMRARAADEPAAPFHRREDRRGRAAGAASCRWTTSAGAPC